MDFEIERVTAENYPLFEDMVFWRQTGSQRTPSSGPVSRRIKDELGNPNLHLYAAKAQGRYMGWISLVYIPKVGKWDGRGHLYVDELWVAPALRCKGIGRALLAVADRVKHDLDAAGIRLYVNVENSAARRLYEKCGFAESGQAHFMEK